MIQVFVLGALVIVAIFCGNTLLNSVASSWEAATTTLESIATSYNAGTGLL